MLLPIPQDDGWAESASGEIFGAAGQSHILGRRTPEQQACLRSTQPPIFNAPSEIEQLHRNLIHCFCQIWAGSMYTDRVLELHYCDS